MDDNLLTSALQKDFSVTHRIPRLPCPLTTLCWWHSKAKRYRVLMRKAQSRFTKEMDLQKFIHRQRVAMAALLGLLTKR